MFPIFFLNRQISSVCIEINTIYMLVRFSFCPLVHHFLELQPYTSIRLLVPSFGFYGFHRFNVSVVNNFLFVVFFMSVNGTTFLIALLFRDLGKCPWCFFSQLFHVESFNKSFKFYPQIHCSKLFTSIISTQILATQYSVI